MTTQPRNRNHARFVFGGLAGLTGIVLAAAFVAPFYGALDQPVVIDSDQAQGKAKDGSGGGPSGGIVVEKFDYNEPNAAPPASGDTAGKPDPALPLDGEHPAWKENGKVSDHVNDRGLQREPPRPPLSDLGPAATPPSASSAPAASPAPAVPVGESEQMQLLQRPVAVAAGRFESRGRIIELQGIEIPSPEETCQSPSGASWPCGMQARTAFRQWLRSRAVMCRLPETDNDEAVSTACKVGEEDAARWLVENGWARATAGGPYEEAGRKAQDAHLGLFGEKPDTSLPDTGSGSGDNPLAPQAQPAPGNPQPAQPQGDFPPAPAAPAQ
ncbi:MAG: thermonuclease family protein [Rhizobiales bacterium]|nr:thermonuclease family protein [Hyphomicrobiales bacterium]OJY07616.1 MAG: hypothetical protein BGP07_07075 [Rhizobiales bacterium 63-22]